MYPPEFVALYLMIGLGVAITGIMRNNARIGAIKVSPFNILVGIPLGILINLTVMLLWPTFVVQKVMSL